MRRLRMVSGTVCMHGKGFENVETAVRYDAGQDGSTHSVRAEGVFALSSKPRGCLLFLDQSTDGEVCPVLWYERNIG